MSSSDSEYPTPAKLSVYKRDIVHIERDLDRKADTTLVNTKFNYLEKEISDLENEVRTVTALAAKAKKKANMPHECYQRENIERISNAVDGWSKWWRGILISIIGFLVVIGGSWLYQYFTLTSEVSTTKESVNELKNDVQQLEVSQNELKAIIENNERANNKKIDSHLEEIRTLMATVVTEIRDEKTRRN